MLVEPDPLNAGLIRRTTQRSGLEDVILVEAALSDSEGTAHFARDRVSGATGQIEEVDSSHDRNTIQGSYASQIKQLIVVPLKTLDGLIDSGLPAPDLLKIDVEGAEYLVAKGGAKMFQNQRTAAIIEIMDPRAVGWFESQNYRVKLIDEQARNYFVAPKEDAAYREFV